MKREIIKALAYPVSLARGGIDLHDCDHCGHYDETGSDCSQCVQAPECEWLRGHDEFASLEEKSLEELESALQFALGLVAAQITHWGHAPRVCRCEACAWLRQAQRLFERVVAKS